MISTASKHPPERLTSHVVIHEEMLTRTSFCAPDSAARKLEVLKNLSDLRQSNQHVVEYNGDPMKIASKINCEHTVILHGCFLGLCINAAYVALTSAGARVEISPSTTM